MTKERRATTTLHSSSDDCRNLTLADQIASRKTALTLQEFAEVFSISYKTAFEYASQGRIPAMRIGSNWRLDPATLAAWVREQQITAVKARKPRSVRIRRTGKSE